MDPVDDSLMDETKVEDEIKEKANSVIKVKVLFFARAREVAGVGEESLEIARGSTAADCLNILLIKYPKLKEIYGSMLLALNEEYAPDSSLIKNGDELAIIPPISGG